MRNKYGMKKEKAKISLSELEKGWRKLYSNPNYNEYDNFNEFVQSWRDSGWIITEDEKNLKKVI